MTGAAPYQVGVLDEHFISLLGFLPGLIQGCYSLSRRVEKVALKCEVSDDDVMLTGGVSDISCPSMGIKLRKTQFLPIGWS